MHKDNGQSAYINTAIVKLERFLHRYGWSGYDPFDALNSPVVRALSFNQKWIRVAWTQLFRRSPVNLRPLFFTQKGINPKGLGLFLSAAVNRYRVTTDEQYKVLAQELGRLILDSRVEGYSGDCWGYNFDWQNTRFLFKKGTPTVVNTAFVVDGLLDAYQIWKQEEWLESARSAVQFVLNDIHRSEDKDGICLAYTPDDQSMVYNASLMGGKMLARMLPYTSDNEAQKLLDQIVGFALSRQRSDGSWSYGEWSIQQHIDSYHTGFNLDALIEIASHRSDPRIDKAVSKGLEFYVQELFEPDGFPKFLSNQKYPVDIHNITALIPLAKGMKYRDNRDDLMRISRWFIDEMQGRDGHFYFRKGRRWTNRTPFIRWGQAWSYLALSEYEKFLNRQDGKNN